jgi:lysylphosphatidylglycerol synthetase-like protein (DUF2156 family)
MTAPLGTAAVLPAEFAISPAVAHALLAQFFFVKAGLPQLSTLSPSIVRTVVAIVAATIIIGYWLRRRRTVLRRNDDPSAVRPLLITAIMVIAVTPWSRCALRGNGGAGSATDNRTNRCPATAAHCAAEDGTGGTAQYCTAHRVLSRCVL